MSKTNLTSQFKRSRQAERCAHVFHLLLFPHVVKTKLKADHKKFELVNKFRGIK